MPRVETAVHGYRQCCGGDHRRTGLPLRSPERLSRAPRLGRGGRLRRHRAPRLPQRLRRARGARPRDARHRRPRAHGGGRGGVPVRRGRRGLPRRPGAARARRGRVGGARGRARSSASARSTRFVADAYGAQDIVAPGRRPRARDRRAPTTSSRALRGPRRRAALDRRSPASTSCAAPTARSWCSRTTCARRAGFAYAVAARRGRSTPLPGRGEPAAPARRPSRACCSATRCAPPPRPRRVDEPAIAVAQRRARQLRVVGAPLARPRARRPARHARRRRRARRRAL